VFLKGVKAGSEMALSFYCHIADISSENKIISYLKKERCAKIINTDERLPPWMLPATD